jgi:hypothetical protein
LNSARAARIRATFPQIPLDELASEGAGADADAPDGFAAEAGAPTDASGTADVAGAGAAGEQATATMKITAETTTRGMDVSTSVGSGSLGAAAS